MTTQTNVSKPPKPRLFFIHGLQRKAPAIPTLVLSISLLSTSVVAPATQALASDQAPATQMFQLMFPGNSNKTEAPTPKKISKKPSIKWFQHNKILTIEHLTGKKETESIEKTIQNYVASRIFKDSDVATLSSVHYVLKTHVFPAKYSFVHFVSPSVNVSSPHEIVSDIRVTKEELNMVAKEILSSVKSSHLDIKVGKVLATKTTPVSAQKFIAESFPKPGTLLNVQNISDISYAMSQVPGFGRVDTLIKPGSALDTDNLLVNASLVPTFSGSQIEIDNYGYAPTGALTLNATGNANNVGVAGGLFSVSGSTSFGGMYSGTVSYSLPVLSPYLRAGVDLNAVEYKLGLGFSPFGHGVSTAQLEALGIEGDNYMGDLWFQEVLVERPDSNLTLKEILSQKEFQDTYSATEQNLRSVTSGTVDLSGYKTFSKAGVSFDISDTEYSLTQGAGSASVAAGNVFADSTPGLQNYANAVGQIYYTFNPTYKVSVSTNDQQYFGGGELDPMLQAILGGPSTLMALPTASLFGNSLYSGTLMLTRNDPTKYGLFETSAFFQVGNVVGINTNYSAMGPGIEENYTGSHWFAKADLAVPVGGLPVQAMGSSIPSAFGGNIANGGIPVEAWFSAGLKY